MNKMFVCYVSIACFKGLQLLISRFLQYESAKYILTIHLIYILFHNTSALFTEVFIFLNSHTIILVWSSHLYFIQKVLEFHKIFS
jgi:hypothetical protein